MSYKVKLDIFEGPFDLLVYLIERSGLSIYDVNIADITNQYVQHVNAIKLIDPETAAEFMVLAATLIQIKSRMLLPQMKKEGPAEVEEDPRDELARKIEEYRKIKLLSERMRLHEMKGSHIYAKPREDISEYTDAPVEKLNMDMDQFISSFKAFLERRRRIEDVKKRYQRIDRERMTMERKSEHMRSMVMRRVRLDFTELISNVDDLYDIVLTFVTMLEMLKAGMITVEQDSTFGNITVIRNEEYEEKEETTENEEEMTVETTEETVLQQPLGEVNADGEK